MSLSLGAVMWEMEVASSLNQREQMIECRLPTSEISFVIARLDCKGMYLFILQHKFFFLSELEYKYLPLEIFIKQKLAFQLCFFTSVERITHSCLRKNDLYGQYYGEIWTWGCYLLIVFVFGRALVLFHLVVDGKNIIFPWYKEFQSCRAHSFPDWIIESIQR